jgi:hypothetical protein
MQNAECGMRNANGGKGFSPQPAVRTIKPRPSGRGSPRGTPHGAAVSRDRSGSFFFAAKRLMI